MEVPWSPEYCMVKGEATRRVTVLCATDYTVDKAEDTVAEYARRIAFSHGTGDNRLPVATKAVAVEGPFADDDLRRLWLSMKGMHSAAQK